MAFNYSKDGITVSLMLDTSHPKKDGTFPVRVRVGYRRMRQYYPTGKALTAEEWEVLPTTKIRTIVATRKDIENSYAFVRDTVGSWPTSGPFLSITSTTA